MSDALPMRAPCASFTTAMQLRTILAGLLVISFSPTAFGDLIFQSVRYDGSVRSGMTTGVERHFTDTDYDLGGSDIFDVPLPGVPAFPVAPLLTPPFNLLMDFVDLPNTFYQGELLDRTTIWITNQTSTGAIFKNTLDGNDTHPVEFEAFLYDDELGPLETLIVHPVVENFAIPHMPPSISSITGRGSLNNPIHIQLQMTANELAFRNGFIKLHLYFDRGEVPEPSTLLLTLVSVATLSTVFGRRNRSELR
jgi:hypothetical protein